MNDKFKFRVRILGNHLHITVFGINRNGSTYQNTGVLVMDKEQWADFCEVFEIHQGLVDVSGEKE